VTDNVIHLAFRSPHVEDDERALLACKNCRNKTFLMVRDKVDWFPLMQCSACGQHLGRMGWAHDDDPMLAGKG
jgi:DNA-directed RNA polymerase subunit RPC12/RpoP